MTDAPPAEWGISLDLGSDWYPVPLDIDPDAFGATVVEALIEDAPAVAGRPVSREIAEAVASEFVVLTRNAQQTGAFATSLFRPVYDAPTVAVLEAHVNERTGDLPLAAWVEMEHREPVLNRQVTEVQLPVGPAVRLWEVGAGPRSEPEAVVVETVAHYLDAPGGDVIRLALSWTSPGLSAELRRTADQIAHDLAFQ
jgi:hypothetical protein